MPTLSTLLQNVMQRAGVGAQTLSKLTGIPRTSIDNWRDGTAQRPRHWRPLLQIVRVLSLSEAEADALLAAAGYPTVARLAATLPPDHPERRYLQPWLEATPTTSTHDLAQRLHAIEAQLAHTTPAPSLHQLRAPVADFVGRAEAITTLLNALRSTTHSHAVAAISGVRGMGGIGKTELAYVVAQQLQDTFPDAQIVVHLQGASAEPLSSTQALQAVIFAFTPEAKLPDQEAALLAHYRSLLHGRRILILADDARDAAQVQPLLPPAGCALLITSRTRLMLPGMTTLDLEQLDAEAGVALLQRICDRLTPADAQAMAQACGYLPLALRISATVLHNDPALPIAGYLAHLRDERHRLQYLRDPDQPSLDVEASLALSYAQLDAVTQYCFRQLGVFVADFAAPLALAVIDTMAESEIETTLRLLLRRNLIMYDAVRIRWRLHDLLRDLARRMLEAAGEAEAAQWRYARAAIALAAHTQEQYLASGERALRALAQFDAERPHIDVARRWAQHHAETPDGGQLLLNAARATRSIGFLRYNQRYESIPLWEEVCAAARRLGDQAEEGRALGYLGLAYARLGELHTAISYYEQRLVITRTIGDRRSEGIVLDNLGSAYADLGEPHTAISYHEQARAIACAIGDRLNEGNTLGNLGLVYADLGELHTAVSYYEQARAIACTFGNRRNEAIALSNLGNLYTDLGNTQSAIDSCEEALAIKHEIGDRFGEGYALSYLARAQAMQGNLTHARSIFAQAAALFQEIGDRSGEAECHWLFGLALAHHGEREQGLPLLRAGLAYEQEIGHAKAAEHATLVASLEAGEPLPSQQHAPTNQRTIGNGQKVHSENGTRP